jgi:hypothetical protein
MMLFVLHRARRRLGSGAVGSSGLGFVVIMEMRVASPVVVANAETGLASRG